MRMKISDNMKNVAKISTGTVTGQIISIISLPFITRIYGAEIMGIWAIIYSLVTIINSISDMGMTQAVMIDEESKVRKTYSVISVLILIISIISTIFVYCYCSWILKYNKELICIVVFFTLVYAITLQYIQIACTWLNREKQYDVLMKNSVINQGIMSVVAIILGVIGFKKCGYYIGVTLGQVVTLIYIKKWIPIRVSVPNRNTLICTIKEHKEFIKYQLPSNITIQIRNELPNILISAFFGNEILGYYSISQKLLNIPITFIGQSLGKVFYQRCAEMRRQGESIGDFVNRNLIRATRIAMIPMVLLAAFGDAAIVMFFGSEYSVGGVIVRIVIIRSFFTFVSVATQGLDIVLKKQKYSMMTGIIQSIGVSLAVIVSYFLTKDIIVCCIMMTAVFSLIQVGYFCFMYNIMGLRMSIYIRNIFTSILVVIIGALLLRYTFLCIVNLTRWSVLEFLKGFMVI